MEENCKTDHDAVVTLVAVVKNLKEGQDKFHVEMKDSFKDLKDNFAVTLANHEERIVRLETSKTKQTVLMSIGISIMGVLVGLMVYHIAK
ncbi:MAG: hypothetical protein WC823_00270 [Parcubacteria group bacterium]|jgi:hypothetical protein